ncbi:hypothetical protein EDD15DRAFT_2380031 [Pisolithus albus]|nr:hypothetical protein EDD15DRAFT_2380029 [Pisolithus albus]KAI5981240.1 hypothetical protein EDD15DRAFT_2380031 [Pisolithus albus]
MAGKDVTQLCSLVSLPKNNDGDIPGLSNAVEVYYEEALNLLDRTGELVWKRLNSPDPTKSGISNTPFHKHLYKSTMKQYILPVVALLAMLIRQEYSGKDSTGSNNKLMELLAVLQIQDPEEGVVSTVHDLPTKPIQEFVDHINSHVAHATLGYGLMTVMDDNDLGRGPQVEQQQVNLCNVDGKFMTAFIQGVEHHVLKNCYTKNALDIGIHHNVVDMDFLMGGQSPTEAHTNNVRWLEGAPKTKAILYNGNHHLTYMQEHLPFVPVYNQHKLSSISLAMRQSVIMHAPHEEALINKAN